MPLQISKNNLENVSPGINPRLFFLLLLCLQLLLVFQGLEPADTGFYAVFYQQIFSDPKSVAYCFMFWLSGVIGGLFLKIFPFSGIIGLRLLWVAVYITTIIVTYRFLRKYVHESLLQWSLLILTLHLNNDPKEFYYNNFSSLLYVVTAILLFKGLVSQRFFLIFLSGAIISLNAFNRFPNILGVGLGLAIIYYGIIYKPGIRTIFRMIGSFAGGFLVMTGLVLFIMKLTGQLQYFVDALSILAGMGQHSATINRAEDHYSIWMMLKTIIHHFGVTVFVALGIILGIIIYYSIEGRLKKMIPKIGPLLLLFKIAVAGVIILLIFRGNITLVSINNVITGICLVVGAYMILFSPDREVNLILFIGMFIMIQHPMGSSEGIRTVEKYSLWIVFPIVFDRIYSTLFLTNGSAAESTGRPRWFIFNIGEQQLREVKKATLVLSIFSCLYFTYYYPHSDWENRKDMHYAINNKYMRFVYTGKGRAELLNELLAASEKYVKPGDVVMAYDCIPIYHYMTDTKPYMRNPWPWLYLSPRFQQELDDARAANSKLPVIVLQTASTLVDDASYWPLKRSQGDYMQNPTNIDRNRIMEKFMAENNYQEVWSNSYFKILVPPAQTLTIK